MRTVYLNLVFLFSLLLFTGCSNTNYFVEVGKKHNINYKTLRAIAEVESGNRPYTVNVNKSIFNIQQGGHYFDSSIAANMYMDMVLDPLGLNYDIGLCQVNSSHLDRFDLDNEDLLDEETNIDIATRIYKWNLKQCDWKIVCALSMYNTGKKNSTVGKKYAKKVLDARKRLFGN